METWQKYIIDAVVLLSQAPPVVVQQAANWTSVIMAAITIVPSTIGALVTGMVLLQSRKNAEVAARTAAAVAINDKKTDTVIEKATEIHTLTNSNLSKVQSQLDVANQKIEGFHSAQAEANRKMANMELLITSLIPPKGQPSPSQVNGAKLDTIKSMLSDVQHGTPPIPVKDEAVLKKLEEVTVITDKKLDTIQEAADVAAQEKAKEKRES